MQILISYAYVVRIPYKERLALYVTNYKQTNTRHSRVTSHEQIETSNKQIERTNYCCDIGGGELKYGGRSCVYYNEDGK